MNIDEYRILTPTSQTKSKGKLKEVLSDHNPMIGRFNLKYKIRKPTFNR